MIRHIAFWNYKDGIPAADNAENARRIKTELEALSDCVNGIIELKVIINPLTSSNMDIALNSLFKDEEALAAYKVHPGHVRIGEFIGAVMQNRACIDYYE